MRLDGLDEIAMEQLDADWQLAHKVLKTTRLLMAELRARLLSAPFAYVDATVIRDVGKVQREWDHWAGWLSFSSEELTGAEEAQQDAALAELRPHLDRSSQQFLSAVRIAYESVARDWERVAGRRAR